MVVIPNSNESFIIVGGKLFPRWLDVCLFDEILVNCWLLVIRRYFFGVWTFGSIDRQALSQAWLHEQVAPFQYFGILAHLGLWGIDRWEVHLCNHIMYIYIYYKFVYILQIPIFVLYTQVLISTSICCTRICELYSGCDVSWSVDVPQLCLPCKFEVLLGGFRLTMCLEPWSVARAILQALPPSKQKVKIVSTSKRLRTFCGFFSQLDTYDMLTLLSSLRIKEPFGIYTKSGLWLPVFLGILISWINQYKEYQWLWTSWCICPASHGSNTKTNRHSPFGHRHVRVFAKKTGKEQKIQNMGKIRRDAFCGILNRKK